MIKSYLFSLLILFFAVLIETAVLSNIPLLPAVPDLVLICSLYFALNNGSVQGQTMGFAGGLLVDFLSGTPFGLNCLIRTILGYISGLFKKILNLKSVFVLFLIGLVATLVKALLIYCASVLFPNMINSYNMISKVFLFELAVNSFLTPFIFKFLNFFSNILIIEEKV